MTNEQDNQTEQGTTTDSDSVDFDSLDQFDKEFDEANPDELGKLPDGTYHAKIHGLRMKTVKDTNDPRLEWEFIILGPKYAGKHVWKNNLFRTADNVKWFKSDLSRCGVDTSTIKMSAWLKNNLDELIDKLLEIRIKQNGEYTNVFINKSLDETQYGDPDGEDPDDYASAPSDVDDEYAF